MILLCFVLLSLQRTNLTTSFLHEVSAKSGNSLINTLGIIGFRFSREIICLLEEVKKKEANKMMQKVVISSIVAVLGFLLFVTADVSHLAKNSQQQAAVTETCLGCICDASSGCNQTLKCNGEVCGLFRITWAYWSDSGKPTLGGESTETQTAYSNCVNDPFCAAQCVQGYMNKFGQDCNGDGIINCYDHAAIHKLGGYGCKNELPADYKTKFDECIKQFA